ncbi:MAG TPA: hypothetical protein VNL71_00035 [Chloroflexota bacterium]|nr:hypothetical protein [Chloroflexota bacterium]
MNLVPVVTLLIEIAQGNGVNGAEAAGAALTIGALVVNNPLSRRSSASLGNPADPRAPEARARGAIS